MQVRINDIIIITKCIEFDIFFTSPNEYLLDSGLGLAAKGTDLHICTHLCG